MFNEDTSTRAPVKKSWMRIPDGTKVRYGVDKLEGTIDGLTEIVKGPNLNPDGKTQYRIDVGTSMRERVSEADILILTDQDGLVLMGKASKAGVEYRRYLTERLHTAFHENMFVIVPSELRRESKTNGHAI
jgi:hypothetical protein